MEGLLKAGVPFAFNAKEFDGQRLTGSEIDALVFGHRLHGRSVESGREHGAVVSADGSSAITYGAWANGSGSARVEGDRLCFVWPSNTTCAEILRNPGGTRAKENEYILLYDGWWYPFSQASD